MSGYPSADAIVEHLKRQRIQAGVAQFALANIMGRPLWVVEAIEDGRANNLVTPDFVRAYGEALGIDVLALLIFAGEIPATLAARMQQNSALFSQMARCSDADWGNVPWAVWCVLKDGPELTALVRSAQG